MSEKVTMHVDIVSAESAIFSGRAQMLFVTGELGDLGILPRHAPLLTKIRPGPVRVVQDNGEEEIIFVTGGILEVQPDIVTILADTVLRSDDMNEQAAEKARLRAEEKLAKGFDTDLDYDTARAELARAVGLLRTIKELRSKTKK
jgi:F-type H+-transporting ATPase subunit epsilon